MITQVVALGPEFDWLPDDTEETLVGTSLHQGAITALATSLDLCGRRRGLPWFVGNQIKLVIPRHGHRAPFQPSPDILVHPTLTSVVRRSVVLAGDGVPALIIEVASESTAERNDINLTNANAKPGVYERIAVAEYLVFDPTGDIIGTDIWARRLGNQGYQAWEPEPDGRWHSRALGISFRPEGIILRVYDQDDRPVPLTAELADLVDEHRQRAEEQQRQVEEQQRRIADLEEQLRRLREA